MIDPAEFSPGQIWTYRGAQLEQSRIVIGAVDQISAGAPIVVSLSVLDAPLPDPETGMLQPRLIQHCPIAADVLAGCVLTKDGAAEPVDGFAEGYRIWRAAFDKGEGGYVTVTVEQLVQMFQTALAPERSPN